MESQTIYWRKPRQVVASVMFFVLLAFALRIIRHGDYLMPETHTEGGIMFPTGYATVMMGNTASGAVTFTSASGLGSDAWVVKGPGVSRTGGRRSSDGR